MKTYVFPGQGSQKKGMGEVLFDEFPELTKLADDILGYSIKELCLNDPDQKLNQTEYTQPALYVVNALSYEKKIQNKENVPDFLAGHSLGEYSALHAAGVFSFEDGLNMVKKRGELMSEAKKGAMAAIINSSEEQIQKILKEAKLTTIDIANHNSPSQIVISGLQEDITKSQSYFEKANAMFIPLNTSGAFHSRYMKGAEAEFEKYIKKFKFSKPKIQVIANVTAKPYELETVAENLIDQLSNCVRWNDSITYLLDQGEMEFEEMGVGDVLTKLIKSIRRAWDSNGKATKDQSEQNKPLNAQEMVEHWNNTYPIGTKVISEFYDKELETRTEAMVLFGHRATVYMKGYNGYFDLREVTPVK
jgi:malonyl CoA-acyl carrier protein transacylase